MARSLRSVRGVTWSHAFPHVRDASPASVGGRRSADGTGRPTERSRRREPSAEPGSAGREPKAVTGVRVAVAFDHRGTKLRGPVIAAVEALGHEVVDLGTDDPSV